MKTMVQIGKWLCDVLLLVYLIFITRVQFQLIGKQASCSAAVASKCLIKE